MLKGCLPIFKHKPSRSIANLITNAMTMLHGSYRYIVEGLAGGGRFAYVWQA